MMTKTSRRVSIALIGAWAVWVADCIADESEEVPWFARFAMRPVTK